VSVNCLGQDLESNLLTQCREIPGQYQKHIRRISRGWHHLRYLADFMTVSTVPLRYKNLSSEERLERLNRVNVTIIEYGSQLSSLQLNTPAKLDHYFSGLNQNRDFAKGRLIVIQDLSTFMIEKIGSAFDVEPGFFRSHLGDYVWLNTRDPQAEIPDLEAISQKSNYFSIQYVQPRYFSSPESLERAKRQAESFNVLRRIDHDGRFKSWSDMPGSDVGLVRGKVSLWSRPQNGSHSGWLGKHLTSCYLTTILIESGILLVDPPITHGHALWSGYGNFHPPPSLSISNDEISSPPYGQPAVQQFIYWTLNQAHSKQNAIPPSPELLPVSFFTMICAQWILMCEYINTRLGQIEWEIELGLSHLYSQDFDQTVKTLLAWRRRLPIYHTFVERSIARLSVRYSSTGSTSPFDSWKDILTNLHDILHRLEILHCRADKIMAVSMAVTAREESKKATQESHAITRVSYLAFTFVPLSFWTSFFSMSGEFPLHTYWIYAAVALPITACAITILAFAGSIGKIGRKILENWGVREKINGEKWNGGD